MAYWQNRSLLRISPFSIYRSGSKSLTWAATFALYSPASNRLKGPIPFLPASRFSQKAGISFPTGVTLLSRLLLRVSCYILPLHGQTAIDPNHLAGDIISAASGQKTPPDSLHPPAVPILFKGIMPTSWLSSLSIFAVISVSIKPGAMALQQIPRPANSRATDLVKPIIPALEAE